MQLSNTELCYAIIVSYTIIHVPQYLLVSDIFSAKATASNVPPNSPGNGISCTA